VFAVLPIRIHQLHHQYRSDQIFHLRSAPSNHIRRQAHIRVHSLWSHAIDLWYDDPQACPLDNQVHTLRCIVEPCPGALRFGAAGALRFILLQRRMHLYGLGVFRPTYILALERPDVVAQEDTDRICPLLGLCVS
jgi:hypothetical protein